MQEQLENAFAVLRLASMYLFSQKAEQNTKFKKVLH